MKWGRKTKIGVLVIGTILLMLIIVGIVLFGKLRAEPEVEVSVPKTQNVNREPQEEQVEAETTSEWLYFKKSYEGQLTRWHLEDGTEQVVSEQGVENWVVGGDKILYGTKEDWAQMTESEQPEVCVINELYMADLDGSNPVKLMGAESELGISPDKKVCVTYSPVQINKEAIYFIVSVGVPETDYIMCDLYMIDPKGENLRRLSQESFTSMSGFYITDKYFYYSESYWDEEGKMHQINLETGEQVIIGEQNTLLGVFDNAIYFTQSTWGNPERTCSLYKISLEGAEKVKVCELPKEVYSYQVKLIQDTVYYTYTQEASGEYMTYHKKYDLKTGETAVVLPQELGSVVVSDEKYIIGSNAHAIYYMQYDESGSGTNELYCLDERTQESKKLKAGIWVGAQVVSVESRASGKEKVVLSKWPKMKKTPQISQEKRGEEWVYYSQGDGLYRMDTDGQEVKKLFDLEKGSAWDYIEGALYFSYQGGLYRGDLHGQEMTCIVSDGVANWQTIEDKQTGEPWLRVTNQSGYTTLSSLDGKRNLTLSQPHIGQVILSKGVVIYDLARDYMNEDAGVVEETLIYQSDLKGSTKTLIDYRQYYQEQIASLEEAWGPIYSELVDCDNEFVYFTINDYNDYAAKLYRWNRQTEQCELVYVAETGLEPNMYVQIEEDTIQLSYSEMRHSSTHKQLDKKTYQIQDTGAVIGEKEGKIYKLKHDGIYTFDRKTKATQKLTEVFPMYWYDDYKYNFAEIVGDYIYFNDYERYPTDEDDRTNMVDTVYRLNMKTLEREKVVNQDIKQLSFYSEGENRMDENGYGYFEKGGGDVPTQIVKLKEEMTVVFTGGNDYIDHIEIIRVR
ncbi:MAG: hypothetical protein ACRCTE_02865 [Cellulosilyticaceae bacterium]